MDADPPNLPLPVDRLEALGRKSPRRKPDGGPPELTPRHKLLISYMTDGCGHESICKRIEVERPIMTEEGVAVVKRHPKPHEPLSLLEAADLLRIRRRNARELMTLPVFQRAYNEELKRYRDGERAASLRTLVEVRDDPGLGKAADRKVRVGAAMALLGEAGNTGPTVNVSVGAPFVAGVVIDLRDPDDIERDDTSTRLIDHERT